MSEKNGSYPRLDRIERTLDRLVKTQVESDARQDRRWAEQDRRWAEQDRRWAEQDRRWDARHAKLQSDLKRWAALGVQEARNQRKRRQVLDEIMKRLAAAQLATEIKLKNLLSSGGNGGNGGGKRA